MLIKQSDRCFVGFTGHMGDGAASAMELPAEFRSDALSGLRSRPQPSLTEAFAARELTLPLYPSLTALTEAQVDTIVSAVVHCYGAAKRT
jgi:hypothetical protein